MATESAEAIDWLSVNIYWGDERCVPPGDPASNQLLGRQSLLERVGAANAVYPMSCEDGPEAYQLRLGEIGKLDVIHLGMGSDGHTARFSRDRRLLHADPGQLVALNVDPSGLHPHREDDPHIQRVVVLSARRVHGDRRFQARSAPLRPRGRRPPRRQGESGPGDLARRPRSPPRLAANEVPQIDPIRAQIGELLDAAGAVANRDQLAEILETVVRMAQSGTERLDLKITNAALKEMAEAFVMFAPYRHIRKITMFGSARTLPSDPLYSQARDLAGVLASHGWSTVTGAGPGIMAAGLEGAGPERAFGINIRLPFEQEANQFLVDDSKLVSMKYFFTRKLMLIKESFAYAVLPGGFGTLDEAFELLTLLQTGKAEPAPVVLLEVAGTDYWKGWEHFVTSEVLSRGLVGPDDSSLYRIADTVEAAAAEVLGFYRNYHSLRWVGDTLVLRLESRPTQSEVAELSERFADAMNGPVRLLDGPLPAERRNDDFPDLPRVALPFDRSSYSRLRQLIDAINVLPSAPPPPTVVASRS